jgi:hypothetical protein
MRNVGLKVSRLLQAKRRGVRVSSPFKKFFTPQTLPEARPQRGTLGARFSLPSKLDEVKSSKSDEVVII